VIVKAKKGTPTSKPADNDVDALESDSDEAAGIEDEETQKRVKESKRKKVKVAAELSDCVVICQVQSSVVQY